MWQCPKCEREFKNTDQDHYCVKINTIDEYIAEQPENIQPILHKIRNIIRENAPNATEKMSWRMPTYWQGENLIHFATFKKHIGIYPGDEAAGFFLEHLAGYKVSKGSIQLPLDKDIDYGLIVDIVKWRVQSVENKKS
jgi:uncharacterized protein YdhG (YjbR/CyaY superfamily)